MKIKIFKYKNHVDYLDEKNCIQGWAKEVYSCEYAKQFYYLLIIVLFICIIIIIIIFSSLLMIYLLGNDG